MELPDGRSATVRFAVPVGDYVDRRELDTVALELHVDGSLEAALNTVLEPEMESEALRLARGIAAGLASGELAPTAEALARFANQVPST